MVPNIYFRFIFWNSEWVWNWNVYSSVSKTIRFWNQTLEEATTRDGRR